MSVSLTAPPHQQLPLHQHFKDKNILNKNFSCFPCLLSWHNSAVVQPFNLILLDSNNTSHCLTLQLDTSITKQPCPGERARRRRRRRSRTSVRETCWCLKSMKQPMIHWRVRGEFVWKVCHVTPSTAVNHCTLLNPQANKVCSIANFFKYLLRVFLKETQPLSSLRFFAL